MTNLTIFGRTTREIEVATTESGTKYARFTLASDRGRDKDASTDFFHVTTFGDATNGLEELTKGTFVKMNCLHSDFGIRWASNNRHYRALHRVLHQDRGGAGVSRASAPSSEGRFLSDALAGGDRDP